MSDGPEQTTAEEVAPTHEVGTTETAVPDIAAADAAGEATAPEPAAEAPVFETPVVETTAVEAPVVEAPVVEAAVIEVAVVETTVVEAPADEAAVVETPAVETGFAETTVAEAPVVLDTTVVETTAVETLVVETPVVEAAGAEAPAVETQAFEATVIETTTIETTVTAGSVVEGAAFETTVVTTPVVETPVVEGTAVGATAEVVPVAAAAEEPAAPVDLGPVSSQWGRVTEDGTVFAIAADGTEREIGNWAAGTPAEGLAFYERKFASLKGEVDLLNKRVHGPGLSAKDTEAAIAKLRESLTDAHVVGDVAGLSARLDKIGRIAEQKQAAKKEARAKQQAEAAVAKEALVAEAESLAESQQWKSAGERLRVLVDEWKAAPRLDRKADDELWARFAAARGTFAKHRKAHFAHLDAQRDEVRARKEALVGEAEALADSTDWAETAQRFRNLMQQWKTAGRAQREMEDKLWDRFKAAQDTFFAARNADLNQRDAGFKENGLAKEALLAEAQKLVPVTDYKAAKSALRSIHTRWEAIGMVPREDKARIEGALRDIERAVADAEQAEWKRTNPEARARAQATVDQLRTSIGKFEKELARATEAKQPKKIADAEAAIAARQEWLAQAQAALDEFTR